MRLKKLLPYLLLNVVVSAVTTLAVLMLWSGRQAPAVPPAAPPAAPAAAAVLTPTAQAPAAPAATLPSADTPVIEIQNVFGAGDVKTEVVRLRRLGSGELQMTGWTLKNDDGLTYTFPELLLYADGAVELYSRPGADSVIELHWNLQQPAWGSGMTASLYDTEGNLRASFKIP